MPSISSAANTAALPASRRTFLSGALALSVAAVPATAISVEAPDPIFAAIRLHREAWDALGEAISAADAATEKFGPDSQEAEERERAQTDATHFELGLQGEVIRTVPTSLAGMLAYCDFIDSPPGFSECVPTDEDVTAMVQTLRQFVRAEIERLSAPF